MNESRAAKRKAFSRPQGGSVLHISLQVGVFKFCQDYWYQVRKSGEKINIDISLGGSHTKMLQTSRNGLLGTNQICYSKLFALNYILFIFYLQSSHKSQFALCASANNSSSVCEINLVGEKKLTIVFYYEPTSV